MKIKNCDGGGVDYGWCSMMVVEDDGESRENDW